MTTHVLKKLNQSVKDDDCVENNCKHEYTDKLVEVVVAHVLGTVPQSQVRSRQHIVVKVGEDIGEVLKDT